MKLTIIGCSGSGPGPDSPASSYLVEADGFRVLLDLGHGAAGPLWRYCEPAALDAIVLSHLHSDHCLDMTALSVALQYGPTRLTAPIPVYAPPGAAERIATASGPETSPYQLTALYDFRPPVDGSIGPFAASFAQMNHPVATYATRLDVGGRCLVYTGDTGPSPALISLAAGADVLLSEAGWADEPEEVPNLHLTGSAAGAHATQAGIGRLLLTHVPAWGSVPGALAAAQQSFAGPVEAVRAGDIFEA